MPRGTARVRPPIGLLTSFEESDVDFGSMVAYAGLAAADPKAPFELRALGWRIWLGQLIAVSSVFYLVDPLRLREGGLDDVWMSGSHTMYSWPGDVWDEISSWEPNRPTWAGW